MEIIRDKSLNGILKISDSKIFGYLVGSISKVENYRNLSKIAKIENMFILEYYRNLEIGKKLLQEFTKWCKSKKAQIIKAVVSAQNTKAIEFYRRERFKDYNFVLEK